jgi:ubiquinone/menaquinone biosynthesis C-methylase UbiE
MYRREAPRYDRRVGLSERYRRRAVERLALAPGQAVLDVACGTGINFSLIEAAVGPTGRVVGLDLSPDMLAEARARTARRGWENITLVESAAEDLVLPEPMDAALFSLTHDVLQSRAALEAVVAALRPDGAVASFGAKWAPRWNLPVNLGMWLVARNYVTTFAGFDRPWRLLEQFVPDLQVESVALGGAYVAWGRRRASSSTDAMRAATST